jgi:hypothetical protein
LPDSSSEEAGSVETRVVEEVESEGREEVELLNISDVKERGSEVGESSSGGEVGREEEVVFWRLEVEGVERLATAWAVCIIIWWALGLGVEGSFISSSSEMTRCSCEGEEEEVGEGSEVEVELGEVSRMAKMLLVWGMGEVEMLDGGGESESSTDELVFESQWVVAGVLLEVVVEQRVEVGVSWPVESDALIVVVVKRGQDVEFDGGGWEGGGMTGVTGESESGGWGWRGTPVPAAGEGFGSGASVCADWLRWERERREGRVRVGVI